MPAQTDLIKNHGAVRFPCNFAGTTHPRAVWDLPVSLDLSKDRGVLFRFRWADLRPIAAVSVYFRSGDSWYSNELFASASEPDADGWSTASLLKTHTTIEGQPAGWRAIDAVRLAVWRGADMDTNFWIADPAVIVGNTPIALIRPESAMQRAPSEANAALESGRRIDRMFASVGIHPRVLSDLDIRPDSIQGTRLIVLPYNPKMPEDCERLLIDYVQNGGKLAAFYDMPAMLADHAGIRLGAYAAQDYRGHFAQIRPKTGALAGMPDAVRQGSWGIRRAEPVDGRSHVAAEWFDATGRPAGAPAIILSDACVFMTHVLLPEDLRNKRRLLLSMTAHLLPEVAEHAADWRIRRLGVFGPYSSFDAAYSDLARPSAASARVKPLLSTAATRRTDALHDLKERRFLDAFQAAEDAQQALIEAWCCVQPTEPNEHRAFWCHNPFGAAPLDWRATIRLLADNGFTAVLPNMAWGGCAFYPSDHLPQAPEVAREGDQLAACLAACREFGIACHVWKVCWNMGAKAPAAFVEQMKREGRIQVRRDGKTLDRWLCPSHPANQQLEIDAAVEVARKYAVDGIHLDYIRYESSLTCFCAGCRARFEEHVGETISDWPAAVDPEGRLNGRWLDFRRAAIDTVVRRISTEVRTISPRIQISAAVFPNWPLDRDRIGQDWKRWCDDRWVDFVCPMTYTAFRPLFESMVALQKTWAGPAACYPGIGLSTWPEPDDAPRLMGHIAATRRVSTGGFTVFDLKASEATEMLPLCGQGAARGRP